MTSTEGSFINEWGLDEFLSQRIHRYRKAIEWFRFSVEMTTKQSSRKYAGEDPVQCVPMRFNLTGLSILGFSKRLFKSMGWVETTKKNNKGSIWISLPS